MLVLFATDLIHVSNGFTDVDGNQLTTPEFTVSQTGSYLLLFLYHKDAFSLNIYILNELNHRLPNRLYSKEVAWDDRPHTTVGYCCNGCCKSCYLLCYFYDSCNTDS